MFRNIMFEADPCSIRKHVDMKENSPILMSHPHYSTTLKGALRHRYVKLFKIDSLMC